MTDDDLYRDKRDAFLAKLNQFRILCGKPSFRQISAISERLGELYGDRGRSHDVLTTTALSDILGGRRQGAPTWEKVAAFVLSCQRFGYETRALDKDPGPAGLQDWLDLLTAIQDPADQRVDDDHPDSAPLRPATDTADEDADLEVASLEEGAHEPASPTIQDPSHPPSPGNATPAAGVAQDGHTAGAPLPGQGAYGLSLTAARYLALFGVHAVDLLNSAEETCDSDAAARLGVLLTCIGCPAEARAWLEIADRGGDVMARALLNTDGAYRCGLAAEFAFELALQEDRHSGEITPPDPDTPAEVYGAASARCDHAGAAYWMAARHLARGDQENAAYWFNLAARRGHRFARNRFNEIHEQIWAGAASQVSGELPIPLDWLEALASSTSDDCEGELPTPPGPLT
jgi:hypothetical protein